VKKPSEITICFAEDIKRYEEKFPDSTLITEPSTLSDEEWIEALNICIEENITVWELFGEEYDPNCNY
jgi:hypothetical protein